MASTPAARIVNCSVHAVQFLDYGMRMIFDLAHRQSPPMSLSSMITATSIADVLAECERLAERLGFACIATAAEIREVEDGED